ncbi:hypothetical protein VDP28_08355, partial [Xanthomonas campestris pv. campestris]|nr:hypothetical protein [Xanthomonas campestris pv. campestris]MEB1510978.1 hypothetical protein [Xanthomonas campestris pv. campestris]MEB1873061.1 hypothetical protein [Xanthomonas campestris pv. campestris]
MKAALWGLDEDAGACDACSEPLSRCRALVGASGSHVLLSQPVGGACRDQESPLKNPQSPNARKALMSAAACQNY